MRVITWPEPQELHDAVDPKTGKIVDEPPKYSLHDLAREFFWGSSYFRQDEGRMEAFDRLCDAIGNGRKPGDLVEVRDDDHEHLLNLCKMVSFPPTFPFARQVTRIMLAIYRAKKKTGADDTAAKPATA